MVINLLRESKEFVNNNNIALKKITHKHKVHTRYVRVCTFILFARASIKLHKKSLFIKLTC